MSAVAHEPHPALEGGHPRGDDAASELCAEPGGTGLAFSTFRHDNPGPIAKGDFRA
jgi:hypothetical protein